MGDVGPGKFLLITVSGSLRGDKLLYDEIVCAWKKNILIRNHESTHWNLKKMINIIDCNKLSSCLQFSYIYTWLIFHLALIRSASRSHTEQLFDNISQKLIAHMQYVGVVPWCFFPSVEVGNPSLVMPDLELRSVAWSLTKGWSISWAAVGRAAGSRCKQSFRKLFASEERWSGISGMSLLFPILNIAATCGNNTNLSR